MAYFSTSNDDLSDEIQKATRSLVKSSFWVITASKPRLVLPRRSKVCNQYDNYNNILT